jgi:ribosomal protein L27
MPVKRYDGTDWVVVAGDGAAGAPGTNGTNGIDASPYSAGKNKVINGDFGVNQRAFTSVTTDSTYGFDRWILVTSGGTCTYSTQAFTPGTAPVSGYEGTNFARLLTSGQTTAYSAIVQRIENGRTFAGQTVTVSFWAKAATGTPQVAVNFYRSYGTGGSPSSPEYTNTGVKVTISTSWTRYSATFAVPSVSGKTFGTTANSSYLGVYLFTSDNITAGSNSLGVQNATIDFWGVQVEAGSVATAFQTATGTIQGELAACQRYYFRISGNASAANTAIGWLNPYSTTQAVGQIKNPITMRTIPSSIEFSTLVAAAPGVASAAISTLTFNTASTGPDITSILITTASGLVAYRMCDLLTSTSAGYLGISAEL